MSEDTVSDNVAGLLDALPQDTPFTRQIDPNESAKHNFAFLIPYNLEAIHSFKAVVRSLASDSVQNKHLRKFCFRPKAHDNYFESALCDGGYAFSLKHLPENLANGWKIGCGTSQARASVDILIAPPGTDAVAPFHAYLSFDRASGQLVLHRVARSTSITTDFPVGYNGEFVKEFAVLRNTIQYLEFGNLRYQFVFAKWRADREVLFMNLLATLLEESGPIKWPSGYTTIPRNDALLAQNYHTLSHLHTSSNSRVLRLVGGTPLTPMVAKYVRKPLLARQEIRMLKAGEHHHVVALLGHFFDEKEDSEVLIFPTALMTLADMCGRWEEHHLALYRQALDGLSYLHSQGIWHRDIKPWNLLIEDGNPFHLVIADFGAATDDISNGFRTDNVGTLNFLPPEVNGKDKYDSSIDTWGIALTILYVEGVWLSLERLDSKEKLERLREAICTYSELSVINLAGKMLVWERSRRCSAEQALHHPAMQPAVGDKRPISRGTESPLRLKRTK